MPLKQENVQISNVVNFKDNTFELFFFLKIIFLFFNLFTQKLNMAFQTSAQGLKE